jgi:hypothetical protein
MSKLGIVRIRVALADGTKTVDLGWLNHTGSNVYWFTDSDDHRSYHRSGRVHDVYAGQKRNKHDGVPLADLSGDFHLSSVGIFGNDISGWATESRFSGRESDPAIVFDTRGLPSDDWIHVSVALVEPRRYDVVDRLTRTMQRVGFEVRQVIFLQNVTPWVYFVLTVGFPDQETIAARFDSDF